jgi:hypothetical protein
MKSESSAQCHALIYFVHEYPYPPLVETSANKHIHLLRLVAAKSITCQKLAIVAERGNDTVLRGGQQSRQKVRLADPARATEPRDYSTFKKYYFEQLSWLAISLNSPSSILWHFKKGNLLRTTLTLTHSKPLLPPPHPPITRRM